MYSKNDYDRLVFSNIAGCTDIGLVRQNNEDAFIMADLTLKRTLPDTFSISHLITENCLLLVVSDGVGGTNGGEIASELTVLAVKDALMKLPTYLSAYDRLVAAIEEANHVVWNERQNNPVLSKMAATVTAALIEGNQVYIAEVGDSRAYLIRNNNIKQVTTDQSFVAHLVAKGVIKPEQAATHPRKNIVLQSIGSQEAIKVAVSMFQLKRRDTLLLCSDGLSNLVRADEICFVASSLTPENACWRLVQLAKERGGQDNITLILANFEGEVLNQDVSNESLTAALKPLAVFDPDEEIEKSHKRTKLLGNTASKNKFATTINEFSHVPSLVPVSTLFAFPNSGIIKQDCHSLMEYLTYCEQLLMIKTDQVEQASVWLESNGMQYTKLTETLGQIQKALSELTTLKETIEDFQQVWEKPKR